MKKIYVMFFRYMLGTGLICFLPTAALSDSNQEIKSYMHTIYSDFKALYPFLLEEEQFLAPQNSQEIERRLRSLRDSFYEVKSKEGKVSNEPGYIATLKVMDEMLSDATTRFQEKRKNYALWRLKTISNHCVTCHTRNRVDVNFAGEEPPDKLSIFDKGEFFLATRQFDKAKKYFLQAAKTSTNEHSRAEALRKWMIIYTRVKPFPNEAIAELKGFAKSIKVNTSEKRFLTEWLDSLQRWKDENKTENEAKVDPLRKAENLIRQSQSAYDALSSKTGTVELLRASSLLHSVLDKPLEHSTKKAHALYLLGLVYSRLPLFFVNELPELFLERCVRQYPGSKDAKRSFELYKDIVTLGYTGSGGVNIPDDVELKLEELHNIAYDVPVFNDRV